MAFFSVAAIAAMVIAAAASAYATYSSSQSAADALDYQADVAKQQAQVARDAAAARAEDQAEEDKRLMARSRALTGVAGISQDVGTPLLVQTEAAATAELNRRRILWQGEAQAQNFRAEEKLRIFEAKATRRAGYLKAGTTLLSTGAKAYGAYGTGSYGG